MSALNIENLKFDEPKCRHLKGTWRRQGNFCIMECENGPECYQVKFDVNEESAYQLFEKDAEVTINGKRIE